MDIIYLEGLQIDTIIGVYEWEKHTIQTVVLDIAMATDIREPARSDNLKNTLDYKAVAKRLIELVGQHECQLVETLAEKIARTIIVEFKVPWLRLRVSKPGAITGARDVGVIIERTQDAYT